MTPPSIWLRTRRFDWALQLGALAGVAPAVVLYAAFGSSRAAAFLPLASLVAIPFLHVFGSFFFAFSTERNQSASPPRRLAAQWAIWTAVAVALQIFAPRLLATFALLYGGWHIFRQNFGFVRELATRAGRGADLTLRRLDLAACASPAVALWLLVTARGPWSFIGADVYHLEVPVWLRVAAGLAVPATALLRQLRVPRGSTPAGLLRLCGNAAALLGPALFLDDLTLIYTLSASYHGIQYLAYLAEREHERQPGEPQARALLPLASAILLSMLGWAGGLSLLAAVASPEITLQALVFVWYAIVPFHYFVDGRIWRRRRVSRPAPARSVRLAGAA